MNKLLETIYYSESYVKAICVDGLNGEVRIRISQVSLGTIGESGLGFNSNRDIDDCELVFADVRAVNLNATNGLPNDEIYAITATLATPESTLFNVEIELGSVDEHAASTAAYLSLCATDAYLIDPREPGKPIR